MSALPYIYKQPNDWTCGPAVARIILHFFGQKKDLWEITRELGTTRSGTSNSDLKRLLARYDISFKEKKGARISDIRRLAKNNWLVTAYWIPKHKEYHYSIIKKINSKRIFFHDTWYGLNHSYTIKHFINNWWDDEAKSPWLLAIRK
ncbi:MAG: hypothetical protein A3G02_02135 [Candidatus Yanofskybacteria bacterium RIFCSPLOWO2_12_FULL_44_13b]|nr:MAG: hypothetical protein A2657_01420 [Candidatus Yanofskybacteria bacterium RIFCSPHIGHO2_01_FULL_44_110b]OGN14658.1 MAG: hypothetical protein A3C01_03165 [Candidatus Yanofskybacteria bacterium RIFCSPHIGHO2_02_FULL_44_36b]OGN18728.1 MAG: hypothetical protein A3F50_02345 [Candidatus Yanofskybacteria bacterium RIFCSPHIGHO2_12_FULL_44_29b]OGN26074.1 MAG: hypothetical protein A3B12_01670 [Candidatus Yanofskybacteria bacterium RIFCSPLOWO2_01_FULL_44_88]OGN30709.1 MAG: hypothetical protein A3I96_0